MRIWMSGWEKHLVLEYLVFKLFALIGNNMQNFQEKILVFDLPTNL